MVFGLLRRLFGLVAFLLLLYAFTRVPIGRRTGWEHVVAIFSTEPAREAAEDLRDIAVRAIREHAPAISLSGIPSPSSIPSQDPPARGKTAAPNHVRSAHQGVPSSP